MSDALRHRATQPRRVDAESEPLRLLHVHAHPDDESSKGAATTAKYVAEGVKVVVATCTGGERGSILNPKLDSPENAAAIATLRAAEMQRAAAILGIDQVWLGFEDSGLPEGDPLPDLPPGCFALQDVDEAAGPLVRVIRQFRPHVLTTYDENGGYPHPDHIMCHKVSLAALEAAADPDAWPEHGPAWRVLKVYYEMGFHRTRYAKLDELMHANGLGRPYSTDLSEWASADMDHRLTTFIPCGEFYPVRDDALRAHATQIDPDGAWFAVPLAIQQAGWPTEDYQLVRSLVPVTLPEDDLFAGIDLGTPTAATDWSYSI
ncbi:MAG: mycothiol conjugate amidase Mca [Micropruina sp.]